MKGKGYITFMVAAALSMGFAVTAMAEEPGGGEPGGAQLGTMIEMADRLAPEGEDAAVISHIKGDVYKRQSPTLQGVEWSAVKEI